VILLVGSVIALSYAQTPSSSDTPTFYRLVPGTYVNPWPRFAVHYPKDWVERPKNVLSGDVFSASSAERFPSMAVIVGPSPLSLDKVADGWVPILKALGFKDVTVVGDKPSRLRDGTPAWEVEAKMLANGAPFSQLLLATKKDETGISIVVSSVGKIGEDLKVIPYSIEFEPDKDKPVKVPPDVQAFLNKHCNDAVSHDLTKVMANVSDRFLNSGVRKGEMERTWRPLVGQMTSAEFVITDYVPASDRAYLAGFVISFWGKVMLQATSIIKETGDWKWYGNQRDVAP